VDARSKSCHSARRLPAVLVLAALLASLAACAAPAGTPTLPPTTPVPSVLAATTPTPAPTPAYPATLTDDEGTDVTLAAEPTRIVSLTPAATEILFELGVGDRVVGKVQDFNLYPPEAANVPDVAEFGSVDVERIVGLGADLVIAGGNNFNPPEAITKLRSLGIPVLVVFAPDVKTALADMTLIGRAVGRTAEADALTRDVQAAFDQVAAATASLPRPRVYYELDATNGYFGPAPDYFGTEMIRIAGGEPLTSGTTNVYQIEAEQILAFDPEIILLGDAAYGVAPEQVAARPGWNVLAAVKTGDVRPIDDVIVTRPGPRLIDGIRALAIAIHPDLDLPSPVQ
jgi:iron complex transport system substrate-binding protein